MNQQDKVDEMCVSPLTHYDRCIGKPRNKGGSDDKLRETEITLQNSWDNNIIIIH